MFDLWELLWPNPPPWHYCPMSGWLNKKVHMLPPLVQTGKLAPHKPHPALKIPQSSPAYARLPSNQYIQCHPPCFALVSLWTKPEHFSLVSPFVVQCVSNKVYLISYWGPCVIHAKLWHHFLAEASQHSAEDITTQTKQRQKQGVRSRQSWKFCFHGGGRT